MKKAFRKSLKRQTSFGYFGDLVKNQDSNNQQHDRHREELTQTSILWHALAKKYQFNYPNDWYRLEAHWLDQIEGFQEQPIDCPGRDSGMNNAIIRITQCNDSYQLSNSLPRSFIVPKDLNDVTLANIMSTLIRDHRVPILSYCCPIEFRRNFIIRCASCAFSDQQAKRVNMILRKVANPLIIFNMNMILPPTEKLESAQKKIRDVSRTGEENISNFLSKSGKWLNIVSLTLKHIKEITRTLLTQASVLLIEYSDKGWNSLVSSMVQIVLEPHRRTIEGLESLISKEWIYLSGGQTESSKPDIYFTLFLDCIYQIYVQDESKFEFTSDYLRYLFNTQQTCVPKITNNHESLDWVEILENGYCESMINPLYTLNEDSPAVNFYDHIANMKLWI